jgi:hypothetical protein
VLSCDAELVYASITERITCVVLFLVISPIFHEQVFWYHDSRFMGQSAVCPTTRSETDEAEV